MVITELEIEESLTWVCLAVDRKTHKLHPFVRPILDQMSVGPLAIFVNVHVIFLPHVYCV